MEWSTYIPATRSDGTPITFSEMNEAARKIQQRFKTVSIKTMHGGFRFPASQDHFQGTGMEILVLCDNHRVFEAEQLVLRIGAQLGQKSMYFKVQFFDGVRILEVS